RHSGEVSRGEHTRIEQTLSKILGVCKGDIRDYGLELMQEVNQHFYTGTQIQNARNLMLSLERVSYAFVVSDALQSSFIFKRNPGSLCAHPDLHDGVVVLLVGSTG